MAFVVLLLVSAGMATVPGGDDPVAFVRRFYEAHRAVVVTAQVVGLAAAVTFIPFADGLQRQDWVGRTPLVRRCGLAVAAAGVLAGVPPLVLCAVAGSAGSDVVSTLATASDLVDVVLVTAIAAFAAAVAASVERTWLRVLAVAVALTCAVRAVLVLVGGEALALAEPLAFLVLVLALAVECWRRATPRGT